MFFFLNKPAVSNQESTYCYCQRCETQIKREFCGKVNKQDKKQTVLCASVTSNSMSIITHPSISTTFLTHSSPPLPTIFQMADNVDFTDLSSSARNEIQCTRGIHVSMSTSIAMGFNIHNDNHIRYIKNVPYSRFTTSIWDENTQPVQ